MPEDTQVSELDLEVQVQDEEANSAFDSAASTPLPDEDGTTPPEPEAQEPEPEAQEPEHKEDKDEGTPAEGDDKTGGDKDKGEGDDKSDALKAAEARAAAISGEPPPIPDKPAEQAPPEKSEREKELEAQLEAAKKEAEDAKQAATTKDEPKTDVEVLSSLVADEDESTQKEVEGFTKDYPLVAKLFAKVAGQKPAAKEQAPLSENETIKALQEKVASMEQSQQAQEAQAQYWDNIKNGFKTSDGKDVKGHSDAYTIAASPAFQEWAGGLSDNLKALINSTNPEDGIVLLDLYKEQAVDEVSKQDKEEREAKLKKKDRVKKTVVKESHTLPDKEEQKAANDLEAGFKDQHEQMKKEDQP